MCASCGACWASNGKEGFVGGLLRAGFLGLVGGLVVLGGLAVLGGAWWVGVGWLGC